MIAAQRRRVVPRLRRVLSEQPRHVVASSTRRVAAAGDRGDDASRHLVVALEHVAPDARQHEPAEATRLGDRSPQQGVRAEREADRVDGPVGERGDDAIGEVGVGVWVVRLGRCAVAEQIDADHLPPGVGEQVGEPRSLPRGGERPAPSVHEHHRRCTASVRPRQHGMARWRRRRGAPEERTPRRLLLGCGGQPGRTFPMRMLQPEPGHDLTYSDVFMVPSQSSVGSRFAVDLTTPGRDRHDDPDRRVQHDRRRRPADGRGRRPAGWAWRCCRRTSRST